jgi:hypothetical protein
MGEVLANLGKECDIQGVAVFDEVVTRETAERAR